MGKIRCWNCNHVYDESWGVCPNCGNTEATKPIMRGPIQDDYTTRHVTGFDHTAEFKRSEAARERPYALLAYLLGLPGILIASIGQKSAYVRFHVRQSLKYSILEMLMTMVATALVGLIAFFSGLAASSYEAKTLASEMGLLGRFIYGFYNTGDISGVIIAILMILIITVRILAIISAITAMTGKSTEGLLVRHLQFLGRE
ncbi:MAG: zinc ribbon domain-containing protein [Blautia sp.]|nr:zinc ribbon domain-containing protein [Blautia sp.]